MLIQPTTRPGEPNMQTIVAGVIHQIQLVDCVEGMHRLPEACIPLTVTSPPYDGLRSFNGHELGQETFERVAEELHRITTPGGVVVWLVAPTPS